MRALQANAVAIHRTEPGPSTKSTSLKNWTWPSLEESILAMGRDYDMDS